MRKSDVLVVKRFSFDAAHKLPNYPGPCARLHGHTWFVDVGFSGPVDEKTGMVIDFRTVSNEVGDLIDRLDHSFLNEVISNPTAENIATMLVTWIKQGTSIADKLNFIRVWESPTAYAEIKLEVGYLQP